MKKLLEVKEQLKKTRPKFKRQESYFGRVAPGWRKPKGLQSKLRLSHKGNRKPLRAGYQTPKAVRGMTLEGLMPITVRRVEDLADLNPEIHTVVVGKVGGKNKIAIIEAAVKAKFVLHNATAQKAEDLKQQFADRSKAKQDAKKEKEARDKKLEEKLEKEEKKAEAKAKKESEKAVSVKKTSDVKNVTPEVKKETSEVTKSSEKTPVKAPEAKKVTVEKKDEPVKKAEPAKTPAKPVEKAPEVKKAPVVPEKKAPVKEKTPEKTE